MSTTTNNSKEERRSKLEGVEKASLAGSFLLGWEAVRSWVDCKFASSALEKIRKAKSVPISGLRSLLYDSKSSSSDDNLVVVRGFVQALRTGTLVAIQRSGESIQGVVLQEEGWFRETVKTTVPFVLGKTCYRHGDYVSLNMHFSNHPLPPLRQIHDHYVPVRGLDYPFLERVQGKILEVGREVSAVGRIYIRSEDGEVRIMPCEDLPYFLSDMTKDEMVEHLAARTDSLFWAALFCGSLSIALIAYVYWRHRKQEIMQTFGHRKEQIVEASEQLRNELRRRV